VNYPKPYRRSILAAVLTFSASTAIAAPITIDGDLSDWGISVADGTSSQPVGTDYSGLRSDLAGSMIEDTDDTTNSLYLGPNYGGQNYDGEFMGVLTQGSTTMDLTAALACIQRVISVSRPAWACSPSRWVVVPSAAPAVR